MGNDPKLTLNCGPLVRGGRSTNSVPKLSTALTVAPKDQRFRVGEAGIRGGER
jgi:hypothetical protein